jgi:hypothetical protein
MAPILADAHQPGNGAPEVYPAGMTTDPSQPPPPDAPPPPGEPGSQPVPSAGYQVPAYPYGYQPAPHRSTNGLAIAALVTSAALLVSCTPLSFIGAILGHMARKQIRERGEDGDGLAKAGIILGWIGPVLLIAAVAALIALAASTTPACGCTPVPLPTITPGV